MIVQPDSGALNNAMSQRQRKLQAPAPERVKVDGRSLADLLAFAAEYGTLIHFYDLTDTIDGDWSAFFSDDPSIKLALRATLDLPDMETALERLLQALRSAHEVEQRLAHWALLQKILVRLIVMVEPGRIARVSFASLEHALADLIAAQLHHLLVEQARRLVLHLNGENAEHRLGHHAHNADNWLEDLIALLDDLVASLIDVLTKARAADLAQLETSLQDHTHPPQSGLWDAFAQLFGHAQESINRFPRHLVTFYQSDILRQDARNERPDQLILSFTPSVGVAQTSITKGTTFLAGKDKDGQSITYALDAALTVDATSVAMLRTLTLAPQTAVAAAQVLSGTVKLAATPPAIAAPFPLFGANDTGIDGALVSTLATLGFAVASPCLMLTGGGRTITLGLGIAPVCEDDLISAFGAYGLNASAATLPAQLTQLLGQAFSLRYSSTEGWIDIPAYTVVNSDGCYNLSFTLGQDAAAWVACALPPAPNCAVPDISTPTLYASLIQQGVPVDDVTVYPYTVLSCAVLSALSIDVGVDDLTAAQMITPSGAANADKPFPLFGSPPVQNAVFAFNAPELFVKQVSHFTMAITWSGLPVTSTGFSGYYQGYVIDADGKRCAGSLFDNASFTVDMGVVNPGTWQISATSTPYLFQTTQGEPVPVPAAMPLPQTVLVPVVATNLPGPYYNPAMSYVSLTLTQPTYAFGDILYAPNVMAASLQLTAAASACAQQCGQDGWAAGATAQLALLSAICTTTPDKQFKQRIQSAVQQVVASLDAMVVTTIQGAIAASAATADEKAAWQASLTAALALPDTSSLLARILHPGRQSAQRSTLHDNLAQWLSAHATALATSVPVPTGQAQALLAAGTSVPGAYAKGKGTRAVIASAVSNAQTALNATLVDSSQDCIQKCMATDATVSFPNQPWLPMAAAVSVNYTAAAMLPLPDGGASVATLFHLCPFDEVAAVDWSCAGTVPLLAPIMQAGVLYIDLSVPAQEVSLLFQLAPPESGWPTTTPIPSWFYWSESANPGWNTIAPYSDNTDGLRKPGIVRFVQDATKDAPLLRLRIGFDQGDAALFPLLVGLSTNAASATWVGPGGADNLDLPLLPGTITKPIAALPGVGSITQATTSFGGRAKATGPAFDMWLAERLRHKDYGIQGWDYASLVLAAYPSLWQVAVTPTSDGQQIPLPGHVWVVAVPGRDTPGVVDPTVPSNDAQMLGQIAAWLAERISPFVELSVTNPPYQRLCVKANLIFTDDDAIPACISRLNTELVDFLSPWPSQALGPRPENYYSAQEVAHFVRNRPYVRGMRSFKLVPEGLCTAIRPYYTTVLTHQLISTDVMTLSANGEPT